MKKNKHSSQSFQQKPNLFWLWLVLVLIAIIGVLGYRVLNPSTEVIPGSGQTTSETATLGGSIVFTGLTPESTDKEEVGIFVRPSGSSDEFTDTMVRIPVSGDLTWKYPSALSGHNYEVRAALFSGGSRVKTSDTVLVTAPALSIQLPINVDWDDLGITPTNEVHTISGNIQINGYIPTGASVHLMHTASPQDVLWLSLAASSHNVPFIISDVSGTQNYNVYAIMVDSQGNSLGKSSQQHLANSGDTKVDFVINSTATAPPTPTPAPQATPVPGAKVSGQVTINGPLDANSRLVISGKRTQDNDYQVWQVIEAPNNDGQYWSYDKATTGENYNIRVSLQVNGSDVNTSNVSTVTAPATNINFTLNTNYSLDKPTQAAIADPCQRSGENSWKTIIKIPGVSGAGQYRVQIGSKAGYSDIYNQIVSANGNNEVSFTVDGFSLGQLNYLRYSYSACRDCSSQNSFSAWAPTATFTCE